MRTSTVKPQQYLLGRKNRRTGYLETVVYTGALRQKPAGWSLLQVL